MLRKCGKQDVFFKNINKSPILLEFCLKHGYIFKKRRIYNQYCHNTGKFSNKRPTFQNCWHNTEGISSIMRKFLVSIEVCLLKKMISYWQDKNISNIHTYPNI